MRKKLFKAIVAGAAVCFASGLIIANGGIGTVKAAEDGVVISHDFEDGNKDGFMSNGVTLSIDDSQGSNYNGADGKGSCLKVSGRDKGTDWWERNGLAFDLKTLEAGKTYEIGFDFTHGGDADENGYTNRPFKINTYFTKGYQTNDAAYADLQGDAKTEYENTHTAMYGQIGNVLATTKGEWEHIQGTVKIKEDTGKSDGNYIMAIFMGYVEEVGDTGSYKNKNVEDYYVDNFYIKEYVAPTAAPTATAAPSDAPATAVPATAVPATAVPATAVPAPIIDVDDSLEVGYEEVVKGITYVVTGADTVKVKEFDEAKSKLTIPATVSIEGANYKVTEISANAFKGESDIKTLVIGANVKTIGKSAFYKCSSLKKITISSTSIKSIGSKAFKGTAKKAVVKVPKSKKAAYKKLLKKSGLSSKAKIK